MDNYYSSFRIPQMSNKVHLWLRAESKKDEHRSALTPEIAKKLLNSGKFSITVEECQQRIFKDVEFKQAGCELVPCQSWIKSAPSTAIILGLKELNDADTFPLSHTHIHFAHCYKHQSGWRHTLNRFNAGKGKLLDLEFLVDDSGRRVAAFGYMAGFAGAAIGLDVWCSLTHKEKTEFEPIRPYDNEHDLINYIKTRLSKKEASPAYKTPKTLIIGALGRCGQGARAFLHKVGMTDITEWDINETRDGQVKGTHLLTSFDIFINCIYLAPPSSTNSGSKPTPFITKHDLNTVQEQNTLQMSVIVDVSCDPNNPNNPIPIYNQITTFAKPTTALVQPDTGNQGLHVVAIDHLPSLLPRESSILFCQDLYESLMELTKFDHSPMWQKALSLFQSKLIEAQQD